MPNSIDLTTTRVANDIARLREALADLERQPATEVGEQAHAYAVGVLIARAEALLNTIDVASEDGSR